MQLSPRTVVGAFLLLTACEADSEAPSPLPGSDSDAEPASAVHVIAGPIACEDPSARDVLGPFVRDEFDVGEADLPGPQSNTEMGAGARGVVVADFDLDGVLDVVAPRVTLPAAWIVGRAGAEAELVEAPHEDIIGPFGGSTADVEGDGDPDLLFYSQTQTPMLYLNDGTGNFTAADVPAFANGYLGCGRAASWADVDLDGNLDVFIGRAAHGVVYCGNSLYLGDGAGGFEDGTHLLPDEAVNFKTVASGFHQMDDDPWPELLLVTGNGATNTGFDGGPDGFTVIPPTGLHAAVDAMGIAAADLNLDGVTDFAIPGIGHIVMLVSLGGEKEWADFSLPYGIVPGEESDVGWGGDFADLDNDGLLDLVMGFGATSLGQPPDRDEIYRGTSSTSFERVAAAWGFDDGFSTRGSVIADFDGNGWLDVAKRQVGGLVATYTARCGDAHWLSVRLRGAPPNVDAVGAWIEVTAEDARYTRSVSPGSTGFSTGGPPDLHVGLGAVEEVSEIVVHWPDGSTSAHGPIAADMRIEILHPDLL